MIGSTIGPGPSLDPERRSLERVVSRALKIGTYAAMVLIVAGVVRLLADGRSPLDVAPTLDPGTLVGDVLALRPSGLLWLGVILVLATPPLRVATALVGYLRAGEREMAIVAVLILAVIALGVIAGIAGS